MQQYRPEKFPPVVKNLIILNALMWLLTLTMANQGIDLGKILGMHTFGSPGFRPYQIVSHMFMHGSFMHIGLNMFGLWMFGSHLENIWGAKRFLFFYLACGLGSAFVSQAYHLVQIYQYFGAEGLMHNPSQVYSVGASGAIYGVLMAFATLFPNTTLYLYFLIPVKAKYIMIGLVGYALYMLVGPSAGDNIAHEAHLGGALVGFIIVKIWQRNRDFMY